MNKYKIYIEEFKKGTAEDTVGLWNIIDCIKKNFSPKNESELLNITVEFIRTMLAEGFKAGASEYSASGYVPWKDQNPDYVASRITNEWKELGRIPNIGDIVYFDLR